MLVANSYVLHKLQLAKKNFEFFSQLQFVEYFYVLHKLQVADFFSKNFSKSYVLHKLLVANSYILHKLQLAIFFQKDF